MTKSHWCDRLRPICSGGGGRGRLRACGMREMNRCDMVVVCTDVTATYGASGIEGQHMWCGRAMIGMRRCLECLECGCKVQMSPDVVLECGLVVVGIYYSHNINDEKMMYAVR